MTCNLSSQYTNSSNEVSRVTLVWSRSIVSRASWSEVIPILICGLTILALFLIFSVIGRVEILIFFTSLLTPVAALFFGFVGLHLYNQESSMRQDRFHTLQLWISIGLIILFLSETAIVFFSLTAFSVQIQLIVGLIQMPGLLLWGFGVLQYLRSVNTALELMESKRLWMGLLIAISLTTLALFTTTVVFMPGLGVMQSVIISPILACLGLLSVILFGLVWNFRDGEIANPLMLIFAGFLFYLIRTAQWAFSAAAIGTPSNDIIAFGAYLLLGAALLQVRDLGSNTNIG